MANTTLPIGTPSLGHPIPSQYKAKPLTLEDRVEFIERKLGIKQKTEEDKYILHFNPDTVLYTWTDEHNRKVPGLSDNSFNSKVKADEHLRLYLSGEQHRQQKITTRSFLEEHSPALSGML
jgi:hypothetical protein